MRKTKEELDLIMKQENVSRLWSWSRINSFINSPYEYFLKYIKNIPEDRNDSIYTTTGSIAHDILEKLYINQISYDEMNELFKDAWLMAYDVLQLKFDRTDEEKNVKIAEKYYENLNHFFSNHKMLNHKPIIEQFVKTRIGNNVLFGYMDCCFKDENDNYHIIDFKTSSIYKGDKAQKESGQLVVYAMALNQLGIPFEKIKIAWDFLKYCTIQYTQKNGTTKEREVERCKIGESLQSNAKIWLKEFGYEDQIDDYLKLLLDTNNIQCLPQEVQDKYIISDCFVYVDLTEELINKWETTIKNVIVDILLREIDYEKTKSDKAFWDTEESLKSQSYYFAVLCGYSANLHLPYKAYLEKLEASKNNNDLFSGLGSECHNEEKASHITMSNNELDLSWLDEI